MLLLLLLLLLFADDDDVPPKPKKKPTPRVSAAAPFLFRVVLLSGYCEGKAKS